MKTYWLLGHDPLSDRRRHVNKGIVLPPPLFSIRESENWRRSPKTEFTRRHHKQVNDAETTHANGLVGGKGIYFVPSRPPTRDASQADPWDGNELGWNAGYDGSNPDSLENPDEGFDGRYQSASRKSSNNSKTVRREPETNSLTAVDEITKPLIYSEDKKIENLRRFKQRHHESWKRSWSADAIDLSKVSLKDWFANVFGNTTNENIPTISTGGALDTVKENVKEESIV